MGESSISGLSKSLALKIKLLGTSLHTIFSPCHSSKHEQPDQTTCKTINAEISCRDDINSDHVGEIEKFAVHDTIDMGVNTRYMMIQQVKFFPMKNLINCKLHQQGEG